MFTGTKEVKGRMHTYYQVLLDTRDMPHIVSQHSCEFLNELLFSIQLHIFKRLSVRMQN